MQRSPIGNSPFANRTAWVRRSGRSKASLVVAALSLLAGTIGTVTLIGPGAALATGAASLLPDSGQFFSVPITRVLDTRYGTGVPAGQIAAQGTISFPVAGVAGVSSSANAVVLNVTALNPTVDGFLTVYNADAGDPGVSNVGVRTGEATNQSVTVPVNSDGTVSITNHSAGPIDAVASVVGYYTSQGQATAGDTYFGLPWAIDGSGVTIPGGASQTFQISGQDGVPAGADVAVLQINAYNATTPGGYLTAYPAGSSDPGVLLLGYGTDTIYHDVAYVPLSPSGQITLTNHNSTAVGVTVWTRGYYMPPSTTPAGGVYETLGPQMVYGTATAGTQMAADSSVTFQVTGTGDVPPQGVSGVTEEVVATAPTEQGHLDEGPAGGASRMIVSFLTGDEGYAGYDNGIVSTLSPSGQETITNSSSGIVDVQVEVTGVFLGPTAPDAPDSVSAAVSGSSATVSWTPPGSDGGSPITGYTVTAAPDSATMTVDGGASQVTLTGLANAAADTFVVTASNGLGTSGSATYSPPGVISGTVLSPNGNPVTGAEVILYPSDDPASDPTDWSPSIIGTVTTDANGIWTYTVPAYSALPSDAQAAADNNDGTLNLDASVDAYATVGSGSTATVYSVGADASRSAYVGTSANPSGPVAAAQPGGGQPSMTVTPDQNDLSSLDTTQAENSTWTYLNSPTFADANDNITGNPMNAYQTPPMNAYGYQNLVGPPDSSYSPFVAADGTDLSNVSATGTPPATTSQASGSGPQPCADHTGSLNVHIVVKHKIWTKAGWTIVGEYHDYWDGQASLSWEKDSSTSLGVDVSADALNFHFDYYQNYTQTVGSQVGPAGIAAPDARQFLVHLNYGKTKVISAWVPNWSDGNYRTYDADSDDYLCKRRWFIKDKSLDDPAGSQYVESGPQMVQYSDGYLAYIGDMPWSHRHSNEYPDNINYCVSHGHGFTYGWAASVAGIGIQGETDHTAQTEICLATLGGRRYDDITHRHDRDHWIWGLNKKASRNPDIFYNY